METGKRVALSAFEEAVAQILTSPFKSTKENPSLKDVYVAKSPKDLPNRRIVAQTKSEFDLRAVSTVEQLKYRRSVGITRPYELFGDQSTKIDPLIPRQSLLQRIIGFIF